MKNKDELTDKEVKHLSWMLTYITIVLGLTILTVLRR